MPVCGQKSPSTFPHLHTQHRYNASWKMVPVSSKSEPRLCPVITPASNLAMLPIGYSHSKWGSHMAGSEGHGYIYSPSPSICGQEDTESGFGREQHSKTPQTMAKSLHFLPALLAPKEAETRAETRGRGHCPPAQLNSRQPDLKFYCHKSLFRSRCDLVAKCFTYVELWVQSSAPKIKK